MDVTDFNRYRAAAAGKLDIQAGRAAYYQSHFDLEAGIIALLEQDERQHFRTFLSESGANWCELITNAVAERLKVVGFRVGSKADNDLAWSIWQANSLDADSDLLQTDALVQGLGLLLVQADESNPSGVSITAESAMQACVLYEPGSRRKRIAGYKRYAADIYDGTSALAASQTSAVEVLILPDQIVTWNPGDGKDRPQVQRNPAGFVGLVEVVPQPRTLAPPRSELHSAVAIQDRIHTTIFNRLVATDFAAFRQIWATGVKIARNVIKTDAGDVTQVTKPFDVGANRLLTSEDPASRFGVIAESTLRGYLDSVSQDVEHLAAITQTPPYYLLSTMVNLSADAIKASEAGLVAKCGRRSRHIGEAYEDAMRCALQLVGNQAAVNVASEVIWGDMETRSLGMLVDALVKLDTLGVPQEILWEKFGATPQEIKRWKDIKAAEPAPPVPPPTPVPPPPPPVGEPAPPQAA